VPANATGRSAQKFVVDVIAQNWTVVRRATASDHDIYVVTAPFVVKAATRILAG
jgi:hypothetical protein